MVLALRGRSSRKFSLFGKPDVDGVEAPQIAAALDAVRIAARADVMVKDLSYGEQRQLEIALSLVTSPRLLLLDEPPPGFRRRNARWSPRSSARSIAISRWC